MSALSSFEVDLQGYLAEQCAGESLSALTVLAPANDPFRCDTPDKRAAGEWLATHIANAAKATNHARGWHYALLGEIKPNGTPYTNTEEDWLWISGTALKAGRWLGLIPFDRITDERNAAPIIRLHEEIELRPVVALADVELLLPDDLEPRVEVEGFEARQPYKLALFGEKSSLEPVLGPIASTYGADLFLPTGELSDTMCWQLAKAGAEDGRKTIVFYIADCDPAGWQMAVSLSRKLQAFKAALFPELEFEVHPIALTPAQVQAYGLPSTPLKAKERRADRWKAAMGVEQTEIDALATLRPDLLEEIVHTAVEPYFDRALDLRVFEARSAWLTVAQEHFDRQLDQDRLAAIRAEAELKLERLRSEVDALNRALRVDLAGVTVPAPRVPEPDLSDAVQPEPLIDSAWSFAEQSRRLIARKSYSEGAR